jgi:hypothetical protein
MYVSQLLLKENWFKSPDSDEGSTKQDIFLQILGFCFRFLPQLYSDLGFLAKLLLECAEQTPYYGK